MDYTPLTYPCPKCRSSRVAQDPVCLLVGKPLMLHFFCCDCNHQWEMPYEPKKDEVAKREGPAMQVSYNGFTGELVKLERSKSGKISLTEIPVDLQGTPCKHIWLYELSIYDREKNVTHSFTCVKLEDVKFSGGTVSFNG